MNSRGTRRTLALVWWLLAAPAAAQSTEPPKPPPAGDAQPAPQPRKPPAHKPNRAVPLDLEMVSQKVARHPGNPYLLNELGNLLLKTGRRPEAEQRYEQAIEIDENFAAAWNNLGVVRAALGRPGGAEEAYRRAVKIQPNYALAWYNLGVALDSQNDYDEAIQAYEQAFILDPELLDVRKNPQIISNRRLAAVTCQYYMDMGGTVTYPVESSYPSR